MRREHMYASQNRKQEIKNITVHIRNIIMLIKVKFIKISI